MHAASQPPLPTILFAKLAITARLVHKKTHALPATIVQRIREMHPWSVLQATISPIPCKATVSIVLKAITANWTQALLRRQRSPQSVVRENIARNAQPLRQTAEQETTSTRRELHQQVTAFLVRLVSLALVPIQTIQPHCVPQANIAQQVVLKSNARRATSARRQTEEVQRHRLLALLAPTMISK